ncbi:MAG TPA: signal recognition particle protein [Candidatus Krumholzibacteria bacterium]|nr:signal recognition particle protein [Candidatus Krumholzibacteria bacterium]HRX50294.1 signal recognition particle protein [Candidatus Krumholzibacteria bacterium]
MFQDLTSRLGGALKKLSGKDHLTEDLVRDAMREVRMALLEADVNYQVAKQFVAAVSEKAVGQKVWEDLSADQQVVKIVRDELVELMGGQAAPLKLDGEPIATVMVMGLQGSGKTTFCAKLAHKLKQEGRSPMLVAADIYRPAAIDQLHTLAEQIGVPVHSDRERRNAAQIVKMGHRRAKDNRCDVLIVDTAGRLHIDDTLMNELGEIDKTVPMHEKLLAVDAMIGQEAVTVAKEFADRVGFDGAVLTKMDGDARGGAALSVLRVTQRPVKLVSVGEKIGDLETFHPDRMASRILGMGDVLTLIEKAESSMDMDEAQDLADRFMQNQFTLEDFQKQIRQVRRMGPLKGIMKMLPGVDGGALDKQNVDEKQLTRVEAIINSMTPAERRNPELINGSRRKRIARGSGANVSQVNKLLKQYRDMRRMMRQINAAGGMENFAQKLLGRG